MPPEFISLLVAFIVLAVVVGLAISCLLFYLGSRLQFVLFDVVLRRDTTVGPIWRRFGRATWPWIGLKLLFYLVMLLCALPLVAPFLLKFIRLTHSGGMDHVNFFALLPTIFAAGALFLLFLLVFSACYFLLYDFGLPSMALEATPIGVTVRRVFALLRAETGQVLLFVLLRFVLGFVGAVVAEIGIAIGMLIALIPFGGLAAGLWFGLHRAGAAGYAIMICGWVVLGLLFLALLFIAAFMLLGYVYTFLQHTPSTSSPADTHSWATSSTATPPATCRHPHPARIRRPIQYLSTPDHC